MKAKNIVKHPSELRRTLKAFLTFYKHLFSKESKINRSKFKSRLETSSGAAKLNVIEKQESDLSDIPKEVKVQQKESVI